VKLTTSAHHYSLVFARNRFKKQASREVGILSFTVFTGCVIGGLTKTLGFLKKLDVNMSSDDSSFHTQVSVRMGASSSDVRAQFIRCVGGQGWGIGSAQPTGFSVLCRWSRKLSCSNQSWFL